ncbi:MAG: rhomboid family intramembrane serine protease [Alphaproteobacteria bacterium]|nr:rhomboid family intramembrane serine protease [Alphaproteobacteria bacterium]
MEAAPAVIVLPTLRIPVVTIGLLAMLTVIYLMEVQHAPGHGSLSGRTLAAYGAIQGDLIFQQGEWWRLFTAPMLHASWGHLIGNAVVLGIVGFMLEPLIGPRWFAGLYAIGGLGGALVSIILNDQTIPAVGASGAIMGVLGAAFVCGASAKAGPKGRKMQTWALRLILPALIPMAADSHTDFAGHLGGVVAGLATGVFMLAAWTRGDDRPAFANASAGIGIVSVLFGILAFALFSGQPGNAAVVANATSGLIPEAEMPDELDIGSDAARAMLEKYPHDPRAHLLRGFAFLKHDRDLADAEEQLREALGTKDLLNANLSDDFEKQVKLLLALTLAYENRPTEARAMGEPLCGYASESHSSLYETMQEKGICG